MSVTSAKRWSPVQSPTARRAADLLLHVLVLGMFLGVSVFAATKSAVLAATFTAIEVPGATLTQARGINDRGQIVGRSDAGGIRHGFLLDGDTVTTIDVPYATLTQTSAINDRGQIVGNYEAGGVFHGFLWY